MTLKKNLYNFLQTLRKYCCCGKDETPDQSTSYATYNPREISFDNPLYGQDIDTQIPEQIWSTEPTSPQYLDGGYDVVTIQTNN